MLAFGLAAVAPLLRPHVQSSALCGTEPLAPRVLQQSPRKTTVRMIVSPGGDAPPSTTEPTADATSEIDSLLARFSHKNKNQRKVAAAGLSRLQPQSQVVQRLIQALDVEDLEYRRTAVQALGMIGHSAIQPLVHTLSSSDNPTVRASSSKALAALAMYHPKVRASFPESALGALRNAVLHAPDPVTKLATVGCLTTLACDASITPEENDPTIDEPPAIVSLEQFTVHVPGNETAFQMLMDMLNSTDDVGLAVSVASSLAQVANCGSPERKAYIVDCFNRIAEKEVTTADQDSGFSYVQESCRSHISQLQGRLL